MTRIAAIVLSLCLLAIPSLAETVKGGLGTRAVQAPGPATSPAPPTHAPLTVHEGSPDYLIGQAARLNQGDDRQQLQQIQQQLQVIRAQEQAIRAQIAGKQAAAASTDNESHRNQLQAQIDALQEQLRQLEAQMQQLQAKARQITDRQERQQEESHKPVMTPHPGISQPLKKPLY